MVYPEEFKAKVRSFSLEQKPWVQELLEECLETSSHDLGLYLKFAFPTAFPYQAVLEAESLEELKAKARKMEEVENLYEEWLALYNPNKDHPP